MFINPDNLLMFQMFICTFQVTLYGDFATGFANDRTEKELNSLKINHFLIFPTQDSEAFEQVVSVSLEITQFRQRNFIMLCISPVLFVKGSNALIKSKKRQSRSFQRWKQIKIQKIQVSNQQPYSLFVERIFCNQFLGTLSGEQLNTLIWM